MTGTLLLRPAANVSLIVAGKTLPSTDGTGLLMFTAKAVASWLRTSASDRPRRQAAVIASTLQPGRLLAVRITFSAMAVLFFSSSACVNWLLTP